MKRGIMELKQLLQFKTIAECKTLTEAAERLHISQPALSFGLKRLEEELDVRLFERKKNKVVLNAAGELAFTHACAVLERAEEMKNAFRTYAKKENSLFLGFCDAGPMRLSVPLMQKTTPDLNLTAEIIPANETPLNALLSKKYDAAVTLRKETHPDIVCIPFAEERLMLSVPFDDPLAGGTGATLQDCDGRDIAVYRIYGAFEQEIASFLERLEKSQNVTVYTDYFIFRQMLKHKNVLTFTTRLVQLYRDDGRRVIIPLEEKGVSATYHLCFLRTNKKRLEPVTAWMRENAAILKY